MTRSSPSGRRGRLLVLVLPLLASLSGCSFLANEFGWFDRPAPSAQVAPDAPPSGVMERP